MARRFAQYKKLIDGLVAIREGVSAARAIEGEWSPKEGNEDINALLSRLSIEERHVLARMLRKARDGGIHDTLAYLDDEGALRGLELFWKGKKMDIPRFGGSMHHDWVARREGDEWPDER